MSDDLVKRLRNPPFGTESSERNLMASAADALDTQAAEITRLRAELATARREGMEMPPEFLEWMKREMPSGTHIHNPEWWASRVWKAAIRAAAKEGKP